MPEDIEIVKEIEDCPEERVEIIHLKNCKKDKSRKSVDLSKYDKGLGKVDIDSGEGVHMSFNPKAKPK